MLAGLLILALFTTFLVLLLRTVLKIAAVSEEESERLLNPGHGSANCRLAATG